MNEKNIDHIAKTYKEFRDETGFSKVISLDEIKENDYNLNVTLYVFPQEETEEIDLNSEWKEMKVIESELVHLEGQIEHYLREIS